MYQALYRKWRPRTFDDVVGQEHVTETLKNQIMSGRLSHAYLFIGSRGTGKTSCAKILARAVNCEHPVNGNPCNKCTNCLGIEDGSIPDVVELDAASNNGVDNVRALRDEAVFSPAIVKKRVYIIDEVHMLSTSAFNALLKILEEPPEHLIFILATTELHKVPATILSRCQRHSFKRIAPDALADRLCYVAEQENMRLDSNAASLLARLSDGSLRDGLSLLDQCSGNALITTDNVLSAMGLAGNLRIAQLLDSISAGNTGEAIAVFEAMWKDGKAPVTLLSELSVLLRDILMIKVAPKGGIELLSGGYDQTVLNGFAVNMTREELICDIDSIQAHIGSLRDGRDPKITAELCIIELCEPELGDSIDTLKTRISKLETLFESGSFQYSSKYGVTPKGEVKPLAARSKQKNKEISEEDRKTEKVSEKKNDAHLEDDKQPFDIDKQNININGEGSEKLTTSDADSTSSEGDVWKKILTELKTMMLEGHYSVISNEHMAKGELNGEALNIHVANTFTRSQLEQTSIMDTIKKATQKVVGRAVRILIDVSSNQVADTEKLNDLSKFSNVKFE